MSTALCLAFLATVVVLLAGLACWRPGVVVFERQSAVLAFSLLVLGVVLPTWGLWISAFAGMPSVGGGDAGVHVWLQRIFVNRDSGVSALFSTHRGFHTFYAVTYWAERLLHLNDFQAFRFAFYLVPYLFWLTLSAAVADVVRPVAFSTALRTVATLSICGLTAMTILLPLIHYHQADGYFPLLFGVVPLMATWATYGITSGSGFRLVMLGAWLVVDRFTYGINLGDSLLTAAFLLGFEGLAWSRMRRGMAFLGSLGLAAAAAVFWWKFVPIIGLAGAIVPVRIGPLLAGEILLATLLLLLPALIQDGRRSVLGRLATFAGVNGWLNVTTQVVWLLSPLPVGYHFNKYHLHSAMLLAGAAAILLPVAVLQTTWLRRSTPRLLLAGLLAALTSLAFAFPRQQDGFFERLLGRPPWRHLRPLADLDGLKRIERTLTAQGKVALVILTPSWPMGNFMNASFDALDRWYLLAEKPLDLHHGCIFWYSGEADLAAMGRYARPVKEAETALTIGRFSQRLATELDARSDRSCEEYPAGWDAGRRLRLCYVCFD